MSEEVVCVLAALALAGCGLALNHFGFPRHWPSLLAAIIAAGGLAASYFGHDPDEILPADVGYTALATTVAYGICRFIKYAQRHWESWQDRWDRRRRRRQQRR